MRTIMLALIGSLILSSCNAQAVKEDKKLFAEKNNQGLNGRPDKPDVRVNVNKEYDDKGNVIKYDSTYTYFFSNRGTEHSVVSYDSLFKKYSGLLKMPKNPGLFSDSLFKHNLFDNDLFKDHLEMNRILFDRMFHHMDSLKNNYLKEYHPYSNPDKKRV